MRSTIRMPRPPPPLLAFSMMGKPTFAAIFFGCLYFLDGVVHAGNDRNLCGDGHFFGGDLVSHGVHDIAGRSDENDAVFLTGIHKVGILGKKAVSGMDGVYVRRKGDPDDGVDIQVGVDGTLVRIQRIRFICFGMEERVFVFLGKNADGLDPQFVQGHGIRGSRSRPGLRPVPFGMV